MRYRITFQKSGETIYSSALDLQKIWERALKRADLKVKYSEGFHPQPKIQLAVPLPLGYIGKAELIDIWLCDSIPEEEILIRLQKTLPKGIEAYLIKEIPENQKALNSLSESAEYQILIKDKYFDISNLDISIQLLMDKKTIFRERNNKPYDLRPLILSMERINLSDKQIRLDLHLLARSGATGRPDEIMKELGIDPAVCEIERIKILFKS